MIGEKFSGNLPKFRIESFKGIENDLLCLTIGERRGLFADGRILIVKREPGKLAGRALDWVSMVEVHSNERYSKKTRS